MLKGTLHLEAIPSIFTGAKNAALKSRATQRLHRGGIQNHVGMMETKASIQIHHLVVNIPHEGTSYPSYACSSDDGH